MISNTKIKLILGMNDIISNALPVIVSGTVVVALRVPRQPVETESSVYIYCCILLVLCCIIAIENDIILDFCFCIKTVL